MFEVLKLYCRVHSVHSCFVFNFCLFPVSILRFCFFSPSVSSWFRLFLVIFPRSWLPSRISPVSHYQPRPYKSIYLLTPSVFKSVSLHTWRSPFSDHHAFLCLCSYSSYCFFCFVFLVNSSFTGFWILVWILDFQLALCWVYLFGLDWYWSCESLVNS